MESIYFVVLIIRHFHLFLEGKNGQSIFNCEKTWRRFHRKSKISGKCRKSENLRDEMFQQNNSQKANEID